MLVKLTPISINFSQIYLKNCSPVFSVVVAEQGHIGEEQLLDLFQGWTGLRLADQGGNHFQDHLKKKRKVSLTTSGVNFINIPQAFFCTRRSQKCKERLTA
jgi:hypothetical protein